MAPSDRARLYEICLRTGDAGADATSLYADPELIGSIFVGPYLAIPGCVGLVAVDPDDRPGGYALGARDTAAFESRCATDWWPALRTRYPDPGPDPTTPDGRLMRMIHHPPATDPGVLATHPSHLHMDLVPEMQSRGVGRSLMERLSTDLASGGSPGVHLGVSRRNENAVGFYRYLGFETLRQTPTTLIMSRELPYVVRDT